MARKAKAGRQANRTGSIYKDGSGYRAQVLIGYDPTTGKAVVRKVRTTTHDEAIDALAKLQAELRQGTLAAATGATLETFLESWLETRVKVKCAPKTLAQYRWVLKLHVYPTLGKKKLGQVSRRDVQALIRALSAQKARPKTTKETAQDTALLGRRTLELVVAVLRSAYNDAIKDGLTGINPATSIDLPPARKKTPAFLVPAEIAKLLGALESSPVGDLVRFMLITGTRTSEARGLRWQDVDTTDRRVRIAGQLQREEGKLNYRPVTKTNQDRFLPIPQWLADDLKSLKSKQMIEGGADPDGIVFLNPYGRRMDDRWFSRELAEACEKAKIQIVSPHKLRHTAATLALMETGDLHAVQKMLGHQQVSLTSDLYGHATAESLRPMMDALGKVLRKSAP